MSSSSHFSEYPLFSSLPGILTVLPYPLLIVDRQLALVHANTDWEHFCRAECRAAADHPASGTAFFDLLPAAARPVWEPLLRRLLSGEGVMNANGWYLHPVEPTEHSVQIMAHPFREAANESPEGIVLTCRRVADAPAPSVAETIPQEAVRLDVARQLAATLNHEINNPLFIVSATLEDLAAEIEDVGIQRRLRAALDAVWRVASAVKQIQDIRRVVSTPYIDGVPMIDLEASQERP